MRLGGADYDGSRPRFRLCHGFLYNLCTTVSSCFYVFCCCWLLEDCFGSHRSLPWPPYESPEPPPPPPRHTHFGPLFGSPEPPPPPYHHTHVGPGPLVLAHPARHHHPAHMVTRANRLRFDYEFHVHPVQ
ncbi:hypothetical protein ABFX02_07G020000 [Erythranthe guttata]